MKIDPIIISWKSYLFLGSSSLLSLDPSTLLLATLVAGLAAGVTQLAVGGLLALGEVGALDLSDGRTLVEVVDGEDGTDAGGVALGLALGGESSLGSVDLLGGRVELLELTALAGEEDQAGLVVLETGDIGDERLLGVVDTAVVNGDTDGTGELLGDGSFLSDSKKIRRELPSDIYSPIIGDVTFSSARVNPRPARTRRLYLTVGQCTTGRSLSTGRGATAAALERRASRRRSLRLGYIRKSISQSNQTRSFFIDLFFLFLPHCKTYSPVMRSIGDIGSNRTCSKCTRTRRCQSLRKSLKNQISL